MKLVHRFGTCVAIVAVAFYLVGCNQEQKALDAWEAAQITAEADKPLAIRQAEALILEYPESTAAREAREQVPFWIHSLFYQELKEVSNEVKTSAISDDLDFIRELSIRLSGPDLARPLVRIMEDYPQYELRELAELQIVCMAMWEPLVRVGLSFRIWTDKFNARTKEVIANEGPYDDMLKARIDLVAETMRGMKSVVLEMASGLEDAAAELNSLSDGHSQRQQIAEGSRLLTDSSRASAQLAAALDYAVDFYEDEAFECSKAANTYTDGFLNKLGRSWTLRGCKKAEEKLAKKLEPAGIELERVATEMGGWFEKSKLEDYIAGLGGLDKLKVAVGES